MCGGDDNGCGDSKEITLIEEIEGRKGESDEETKFEYKVG